MVAEPSTAITSFYFRRSMSFKNTSLRSGQQFRHWLAMCAFSTLPGLMLSQAAMASNITVGSPVSGLRVSSTMWVRAHSTGCAGVRPHKFGYSIDNSQTTIWGVTAYDIDAHKVPLKPGTHTVHFKSWNLQGHLCPVVNTTVIAIGTKTPSQGSTGSGSAGTGSGDSGSTGTGSTGSGSTGSTGGGGTNTGQDSGGSTGSGSTSGGASSGDIPSNAISSEILDGKSWLYERDLAVSGDARGSTVYPATTPLYDDAREFYMTYSSRGGERWHLAFAKDTESTHFVYDTYIFIVDPTQVANIELDMNQVMSNGKTVIFGTQCSTYSKTWEYTVNTGGSHWVPSNIACNPRTWTANTWHHVQIASHRDSNGYVTYDWVNVDGTHNVFINAKGDSARSLGWGKGTLLINFQLDGANKDGGTIQAYAHELTVLRW
jgi:hypothetical protein